MEEVECNYCGEVFEAETKQEAKTLEGIHRTEEHIDSKSTISKSGKDTNENMINDWKSDSDKKA